MYSSLAIENIYPDGDMLNVALMTAIKALPVEREVLMEYKYQNRLDLLSNDCYGCTELWWLIAMYNDIQDVMNTGDITSIKLPAMTDITKLLNKFLLDGEV